MPGLVNTRSLGLVAVLVVFCGFRTAQGQTKLQWKLKEGQGLSHVLETKTTTAMKMAGMDLKSSQTMNIESTWSVKNVGSDGKANVVQKMGRVRSTMELPMQGNMEYDSKEGKKIQGPMGNILNPLFDALAEGEVKFQVTPEGKMENVQISESLLKAFKSSRGASQVGGIFSEDGYKQMFQSFPGFPAEAISVGKTWNHQFKLPMNFGTFAVDTTYTYEGPEKRGGKEVERIAMKNAMSFEKSPTAPAMEIKFKDVDSTGKAYFDNNLGRYTELHQVMKMVMELTPAAGAAGGTPMETIAETTTTVKFDEK
jgi:hypothetical protein